MTPRERVVDSRARRLTHQHQRVVGALVLAWAASYSGQTRAESTVPAGPRSEPARADSSSSAHDVRFEPEDPSVSLLMMNGVVPVTYGYRWPGWHWHGWAYGRGYAPAYSLVCSGPCLARFAPGRYEFALEEGGRIVAAKHPIVISGPSTIRGAYSDRSGTRIAGAAVLIGGLATGTIMMFASTERTTICQTDGYCRHHESVDGALLGAGIGVAVTALVVGIVLGSQQDEAHLVVTSLHVSSFDSLRALCEGWDGSMEQPIPRGAAVGLRF